MIDCLIIGDSIAVGTHRERPECVRYATGGWSSQQWNKTYYHREMKASNVIISLGSNDLKGLDTREELLKTRSKFKESRVYWILPAIKPHKRQIVRDIAIQHGDTVIEIKSLQQDKVHPDRDGYRQIAKDTIQQIK